MKLVKSLSLVAAFAAASLSSQAAVGVANDLVLGFTDLGAGASNDVEINLGTLGAGSTLLTAGTHDLGNFSTLLSSTFAADADGVNGVTWAAIGTTKMSAGGSAFLTSQWVDNTASLGVANSTSFGTNAQSVINNSITKIDNVLKGSITGNLTSNTGTLNFTSNIPFNFPVTSVENTVGNLAGTNFSASDLYSVTSTGSTFLGTLAVYQNGEITFTVIPEPSTYAMILGALTIGFVALRRRFSKAV